MHLALPRAVVKTCQPDSPVTGAGEGQLQTLTVAQISMFSVCLPPLIQPIGIGNPVSGTHYSRHGGYVREWGRENSLSSRRTVGTDRKYGKKE